LSQDTLHEGDNNDDDENNNNDDYNNNNKGGEIVPMHKIKACKGVLIYLH
jgi:hypothetical protein